MKFGRLPIEDTHHAVLAHAVRSTDGRRLIAKGSRLDASLIALLREHGIRYVYVAILESGDLEENAAAERIAATVIGAGLSQNRSKGGRVTVRASMRGIIRINRQRLAALNSISGVTLATIGNHCEVAPGRAIATLKIIPFALSTGQVNEATSIGEVIHLDPIASQSTTILVWGRAISRAALLSAFAAAISGRLEARGQTSITTQYVEVNSTGSEAADPETVLAHAITEASQSAELIIIAGESAIMDERDLVPMAVVQAGGHIDWLGAPVFPGNLLLIAHCQGATVIGAPGCARSSSHNVIDLLVPRILAGETLTASSVIELACGGMLTGQVWA